MNIVEIDFETILPFWDKYLWPNRISDIEPYSAMTLDQKYDASYKDMNKIFLAGYVGDTIVAVNSVHLCGDEYARSRGLWVDPTFRGNGYGVEMLKETCVAANRMGATMIWSFPRQTSFKTYSIAGFSQLSKWLEDGEFGPNCYAVKCIRGL